MNKIARISAITLTLCASALALPRAHAQDIRIGGTGAGLAILRILADAYLATHPDTTIEVLSSLGSSGGIKAVTAGAVQLAVSSRDLKNAERAQGLASVEIGRTPFVFAVSIRNSIQDITLPQLADIYSGKTNTWPDGEKIRIVLRPVTDSDSQMVRSMSPALEHAKRQAEHRPGMLFAFTDQENQDSIERIPGALGATSLGQILAEQRRLKALTLDDVRPTAQNLANGSYPYGKTLFLITSPDTPPAAHDFVAFLRTAAARRILTQTGYAAP